MSEQEVRIEDLIEQMRNIEPEEFEELVSDMWEYLGYNTKVTQTSSDRGVDVTATREYPYEERVLIQAKRYASTLSGPELREYVALTKRDDIDYMVVVSTSGFTSQAKQEAEEYNLKLINGESLAEILIRENVVDLLREYAGEIESSDIERKRSPEKQSSGEKEVQTTVGEGEFLTIEVVGYSNEYINYGDDSGSGIVYNEPRADEESKQGTIVCLHVRNKSSASWSFQGKKRLSVTSQDGFTYDSPIRCLNKRQLSPWNNGYSYTIPRDSKSRVALFYSDIFTPKKIQYEVTLMYAHEDIGGRHNRRSDKEKIDVHIDDSIGDNINSLPDSLSLESAYFYP